MAYVVMSLWSANDSRRIGLLPCGQCVQWWKKVCVVWFKVKGDDHGTHGIHGKKRINCDEWVVVCDWLTSVWSVYSVVEKGLCCMVQSQRQSTTEYTEYTEKSIK